MCVMVLFVTLCRKWTLLLLLLWFLCLLDPVPAEQIYASSVLQVFLWLQCISQVFKVCRDLKLSTDNLNNYCSNYDIFLTRDCLAYSKIKPAVNQIETHPYFQRDSLVKFCLKHGISVTAHTPLGGAVANAEWFGSVSCLDDPLLKVKTILPIWINYHRCSLKGI